VKEVVYIAFKNDNFYFQSRNPVSSVVPNACAAHCIWDQTRGYFIAPKHQGLDVMARLATMPLDVRMDEPSKAFLAEHAAWKKRSKKDAIEHAEAIDALLKKRDKYLYPFQKEGIAYLSTRRKALLADQMGLGKSVQALGAIPTNGRVAPNCSGNG